MWSVSQQRRFAASLVLGAALLAGYPDSGMAQTASHSAEEPVGGDPPQPSSSASTRPSRWKWAFSIRNRTGYRLEEPRVLQMSRSIVDVKGSVKISDNWRATAEVRAHFDPIQRLGYPPGLWVDPLQVTLDGKIRSVDIRVGLQQIVWGEADGLRVLDVINPLDYREFILEDFLDSRRPLWAARVDAPLGKGSLQLILVPYFAPGRLPGANDEFGLGASFGAGLIGAATQIPAEVRALPSSRPAYRLSSSQLGARYRRSVGDWDLTANYFYGWEDIPTSYIKSIEVASGGAGPRVTLEPRFNRQEVIGVTGTTNYGPVVLRLEAGWNRDKAVPTRSLTTPGGYLKTGQFSSVIGLDYSPSSWLWVSGQYFLQFSSAPQAALLFPRYNHLASVFLRTNFFREKLRPELFVLTGLNQKQYMIRPRLVRAFGDHFSVAGGADFLGGSTTTAFGYFGSRDRAVVELRWMW